jgi:murein DD-endopeptidase MepM/ murein hydrolase activator NlpD
MQSPPEPGSGRDALPTARVFWLSSLAVLAAASLTAAPPPQGKTYFTISLGEGSPFGVRAGCVSFTATEICTASGLCGSWSRTEPPGLESAFAFEISFEEEGELVEIDGQARIVDAGKQDSFGAAIRVSSGGKSINLGLVGRSTKPRKCQRLLHDWTRQYAPEQARQEAACLERANFGDPADSLYILPFPAGREYRLSQTYCYSQGGHRTQLAYDFALPIGPEVIAARGGVVRATRDDLSDVGDSRNSSEHNHVLIEHEDGTVGFYAHLKQHGVLVEVGQRVETGQRLGYSGASGNTGGFPHLHFGVYSNWPATEGDDEPVNFRNALGPLDHRGGLIQDVFYKALQD